MHLKLFSPFVLFTAAIFFAGCHSNDHKANTTAPVAVDTDKANSDYKPAFAGQTRIKKVVTATPYKVEKIAEKLGRPWAIIPLPDGRLMITEKSGFITIHSANGTLLKKVTGLPPVEDGGQGGLLDVALDPAFTQNKIIYWSFSKKVGDANLTAVAKGQLSPDETKVLNAIVIFQATPALKSDGHFGSRLIFDKDGYLFVSAGERYILEGRKQAQMLNSGLALAKTQLEQPFILKHDDYDLRNALKHIVDELRAKIETEHE